MRYYIALVHKDDASAFGLTFPDLPGCFAASDTWDGIVAAATEALDLWFEDNAEVRPTHLDALIHRPDVSSEIDAGAIPMPIPYIQADTAVERVNITMERALLRAIDETARARGMNRSSFLASAARRELIGA